MMSGLALRVVQGSLHSEDVPKTTRAKEDLIVEELFYKFIIILWNLNLSFNFLDRSLHPLTATFDR